MNSKVDGNPFWVWSLEVYELAGVKNRLIYLQDSFGFDVNISLWCCWRAQQGETLNEDAARSVQRSCEEWNEGVIEPLRNARLNSKEGPASLYAQIKNAELAAERHEQDILFRLSRNSAPIDREAMLAAAKSNLALYASLLDAPRRDGFSSALLRDLIDHIFPAAAPDSLHTGKRDDRNRA
jgi:uncharacterized protein (TIGR02444 family)